MCSTCLSLAAQPLSATGGTGGGAAISNSPAPEPVFIVDEPTGLRTATTGTPIRFENGLTLYLRNTLTLGHNSNVAATAQKAVASNFTTVSPGFTVEARHRADLYSASYSGAYSLYSESPVDDNRNHELQAGATHVLHTRHRLSYSLAYLDKIDPRGSTQRLNSTAPDRHRSHAGSALYGFGAEGAQGRVQLEASAVQRRYLNNREVTAASDVDLWSAAGRFFYRLAPNTRSVLEVRHTRSDYLSPLSTSDNQDTRLLVGADWDATAATAGSLRVGVQRKSFDDATRKGSTGFTFEGAGSWTPVRHSMLRLQMGRAAEDSTGLGSFIQSNSLSAQWQHHWTGFVSSQLGYNLQRQRFTGSTREDAVDNLNIGLFYNLGARLRLGAEALHGRRDSSLDLFDFKRNIVQFTAGGTL